VGLNHESSRSIRERRIAAAIMADASVKEQHKKISRRDPDKWAEINTERDWQRDDEAKQGGLMARSSRSARPETAPERLKAKQEATGELVLEDLVPEKEKSNLRNYSKPRRVGILRKQLLGNHLPETASIATYVSMRRRQIKHQA